MSELERIEQKVKLEAVLKEYKGHDRILYAEDKRKELAELSKQTLPFRAMTSLSTLNECIDGFRKGQLVIISGPPKHGKSQLAVTLTVDFWEKYRCVWFQYELGYEEFLERFPENPEGKIDFYIPNYMESGNLKWVEARVIESKQKFNSEIVFIDLLDYLQDPEVLKVNINLAAYVTGIIHKLKRLAIDQNVLIFLMTHIRKNQWTKSDVPDAEELKDSAGIAQLADTVLMIIRKRANTKTNFDDFYDGNNALLGVVANRHNGRTKKIPLIYDFGSKKFREITIAEYAGRNETNFVRPSGDSWLSET